MKENVAIVSCKTPDEAAQMLALLRKEPDSEGLWVSHGAIVKKEGGELSLEDGFVAESVEDRSWTAGLIGGLVGLLVGPVGALLGGVGGALLGNSLAKKELESTAALLEKAGECLMDGETALLLFTQEQNETALEEKLKKFQITITRMDAKEVAAEIEAAEKKKAEAKKSEETGVIASLSMSKAAAKMHALYGENKQITDGNYDKSLAVKCVNGTFVGKKGGDVIAYKGIPFVGRQPVGDLRWKAPVDVAPDDGVYEAYYFGKVPCQVGNVGQMGSLYPQGEDCLHLNVWKADDKSAEKKPVMVWIHGGAYEIGGTTEPREEGTNFVHENPDVILVSIEYRLNALGFLRLSHLPDGADYPDSQNLGLMDQMAALKWIHENIAAFGGDPGKVTIFGQSAGGGSVSLLPLVEGAHQYFQRVIAQSGSPAFCRSTEQSIACTNALMEALGCKTVADLMKTDINKIVQAASAVLSMPITTPERDGKFLPKEAFDAYESGAAKDFDFMQGCTKDETAYFLAAGGPSVFMPWAEKCKAEKLAQCTEEEKALVESYFKDGQGKDYEILSRFLDQYWFNAPLIRTAENQVKGGGKTYVYYFRVESSVPLMKSGHAIELSELFNHAEETLVTGREFDKTFSKTMRKMWVQFAKTGNPSLSADLSPDGKAKEWPLYDLTDKQVMVFDEFDIRAEKESAMNIVDWDKTYFLTKYYVR